MKNIFSSTSFQAKMQQATVQFLVSNKITWFSCVLIWKIVNLAELFSCIEVLVFFGVRAKELSAFVSSVFFWISSLLHTIKYRIWRFQSLKSLWGKGQGLWLPFQFSIENVSRIFSSILIGPIFYQRIFKISIHLG